MEPSDIEMRPHYEDGEPTTKAISRRSFVNSLAAGVAGAALGSATKGYGQIVGAGDGVEFPHRLPTIATNLGNASVRSENDLLIVSTGEVERRWRLTNVGLVTISMRDLRTNREWANQVPQVDCDWAYADWFGSSQVASLVSICAESSDDQRFTSQHLAITAEFYYPSLGVSARYVIWSYPDAPGLRTQLWLKGSPPCSAQSSYLTPFCARVDYIPVARIGSSLRRRYVGYFNDTQHRNTPETELLQEDVRADTFFRPNEIVDVVDWASFVSLEATDAGLVMLKESHKCVNQSGVNTGAFVLDGAGLQNTGWGLSLRDVVPSRYRWCWASWVILYDGSDDGRELSVKRFDRLRFPISSKRDAYSLASTWDDTSTSLSERDHAHEKQVLPEMKSAHELGIGMLSIDDGWQVGPGAASWRPDAGIGWRPNPEVYPDGWNSVMRAEHGLRMRAGLWAAAQEISLMDMKWNWDRLDMSLFKLDFAILNNYDKIESLMEKARQFVTATNHSCMISWDATENAPRYGYFWAREYGPVHFINRKHRTPQNAIYVPWLALRDYWQLARYSNLNKYQLVTCNPELVDTKFSDAREYSALYCAATTIMGIPEFMTDTRTYSARSAQELITLMNVYNKHKADMFEGFVFAIGDKPSNAGWTGFQSYRPDDGGGYFLILRERLNQETTKAIAGRFLSEGTHLLLEDITTGRSASQRVGDKGSMQFDIDEPGDLLLLRYSALSVSAQS